MKHTPKSVLKALLRPLLFTAGGALAGYLYYALIGCSTGSCAITSDPVSSMLYMGLIGFLLSGVSGKECDGGCSM